MAYIRITTWAWGQIEIFRHYVFPDCEPETVVTSSLLGTSLSANNTSNFVCYRIKVWFGLVKQGLTLHADPRPKVTEVKFYHIHFISAVAAKVNPTVTVMGLHWDPVSAPEGVCKTWNLSKTRQSSFYSPWTFSWTTETSAPIKLKRCLHCFRTVKDV